MQNIFDVSEYRKKDYSLMTREEIIFIKHFFENGDLNEARKISGITHQRATRYGIAIKSPGNPFYDFYQELRSDRVISISITAEKKRKKIWHIVELLTKSIEDGNTQDAPKLLACIDVLNRMDGHYVPVEVHSKQQIQSVNFGQNFRKSCKEIKEIIDVES